MYNFLLLLIISNVYRRKNIEQGNKNLLEFHDRLTLFKQQSLLKGLSIHALMDKSVHSSSLYLEIPCRTGNFHKIITRPAHHRNLHSVTVSVERE